jgi:hypothetical protein
MISPSLQDRLKGHLGEAVSSGKTKGVVSSIMSFGSKVRA